MSVRDATEAQIRASHPTSSTWLSANAGSGKTRVLTDRVARLLLRGVQPQHILCLTYTKAAASEMQNRLFKRLGEWAMKPDADLRTELRMLGEGDDLGATALLQARRLFARAIETPGGLKIQTIHSFCASLLRRFPLEAQVSPGFTELDDRAARLLQDEIIEEMAQSLAPQIIADLAQIYSNDSFEKLIAEVISNRSQFATKTTLAEIFARFDLDSDATVAGICTQVLLGGEAELLKAIIPLLLTGKVTDSKLAEKLSALDLSELNFGLLAALEGSLLYGKDTKNPFGAKIGGIPTKDLKPALAPYQDRLDALMLRVEAQRAKRIALQSAERTVTLHRFAQVFLPEYEARKAARGWLDFDDLIKRALALLSDESVAAWVLFRLDGGIDHVLVDEAQDTSPDQWKVIELLTAEFTAGDGHKSTERTLFVVGDKKQSIYSFQGADVASLDARQQFFDGKFTAAGKPFLNLPLEYSFRSAQAVLSLVDHTFGSRFPEAMGSKVSHLAIKSTMAGRVDLWPLIETSKDDEDAEWENPVDHTTDSHHNARLAQKVADHIAKILNSGMQIPEGDGARAVHPGDILILVRKRSGIFADLIQACKKLRLPIAGADRLKLAGVLAVKDLSALLSFLATPEDNLSLAAVLRSPLCGWSEDQLFRLSHGRPGYLWEALRAHSAPMDTMDMLNDLRRQSDFLRPYDLIDRILTRHDGRRKLLLRLGIEAEDGIDALLSQALNYERAEVPSLTGFLGWLDTDNIDVKRQIDAKGQLIRVMTVHGAKGLEAPIVYLPETGGKKKPDDAKIQKLDDGLAVWRASEGENPPVTQQAIMAKKLKGDQETYRLLYVAMTRAKNWLIVGGAGKATDDSWYGLIASGMTAAGALSTPDGGMSYITGEWPAPIKTPQHMQILDMALPEWANTYVGTVARPLPPLSPSNLGGEKVLIGDAVGDTPQDAKLRGTAVHALLETLPNYARERWPELATQLVPEPVTLDDVYPEAVALLDNPALQFIFGTDALCEVDITAEIFGRRIYGSIDRLLILPDRVLAIDFKTNLVVPTLQSEVPEGLLRQMGSYEAALTQTYPNKHVEVAILWTRTGTLMSLDRDIVRDALARAPIDG